MGFPRAAKDCCFRRGLFPRSRALLIFVPWAALFTEIYSNWVRPLSLRFPVVGVSFLAVTLPFARCQPPRRGRVGSGLF